MCRFFIRLIGLCLVFALGTGWAAAEERKTELIIFAAASLTEALSELGKSYMDVHPEVTIRFNFDSSGILATQILEGAECDIFISAGQTQMDELDTCAGGLDILLTGSRFDILENKVALAVPDGNPAKIHSFEDMITGLETGSVLMAMGGADVPAGQYTRRILQHFGVDEGELIAFGTVTYGSNVKEVTPQIAEGLVDCGIIYQTDACSAGLAVEDTADEEMCGRVVYPAAVIQASGNSDAAQDFLNWLTGDAGDAVFAAVGFTPLL